MRQSLSRFFSDFNELTIFIPVSLGEGRNIGSGSSEVKPDGGIVCAQEARSHGSSGSSRNMVLGPSQLGDIVATAEEGLDVARRLAQALTVLDQRDANESLAVFAKSDPRRHRDIGLFEQQLRESEAADPPEGWRNRRPGEH